MTKKFTCVTIAFVMFVPLAISALYQAAQIVS